MGSCSSTENPPRTTLNPSSQRHPHESSETSDFTAVGKNGISLVTRDSLMDLENVDHAEMKAVRKIQKSVRRTKALDKANAENHWRFFAQVDTLEENETLHLADFMRNLVSLVPGAQEMQDEDEAQLHLGQVFAPSIVLDDIIVEEDKKDGGTGGESAKKEKIIQKIKENKDLNMLWIKVPLQQNFQKL